MAKKAEITKLAETRVKRFIDWDAIEKDYRAGVISIRAIGRTFFVSEAMIRKKAKQEGWKRDLSGKVKQRVQDKLVRGAVRKSDAHEAEIIEESANQVVRIIECHRADIRRLRDLEQKILRELEGNPEKIYITSRDGEIVTKTYPVPVTEKAAALNNLANVQHKRIMLERQAYNIADKESDPIKDTITEILENIAGLTRGLPSRSQGKIIE